jgi:S-adenosylmethionine:tRNA ribosyltransferase-isomerase
VSTHLSDYDYALPESQIAKYPVAERSQSRLLVLHRDSLQWEDRQFIDITGYLKPGDCLVVNETRVIPARLFGTRASTGAKIQVFLHQRMATSEEEWKILMRPAKKGPVGELIEFDGLACEVIRDLGEGEKIVRFNKSCYDFRESLDRIFKNPLPPYIDREAEESDRERYQTVYAAEPGAVAAPTAGLHFTPELLDRIAAMGVEIARITLHTGLGTFKPVETENVTAHLMHEEFFSVSAEAAETINRTRTQGGRIVAVGTTTVRTLESVTHNGVTQAGNGMTSIFIYPPYEFKAVDAIVTNFHMPKSTLLMMISAFAGREFVLRAYRHAVDNGYRFFSYGDAMLIV